MESLGIILKGRSFGIFKNNKNEYCQISSWYQKNTRKFQVIFRKDCQEIASRFAINTTSEKKILKLIKDEGFILVD